MPPHSDLVISNLQVSIVRELHVYGAVVAVHARDASKHQHQVRAALLAVLCVHCVAGAPQGFTNLDW